MPGSPKAPALISLEQDEILAEAVRVCHRERTGLVDLSRAIRERARVAAGRPDSPTSYADDEPPSDSEDAAEWALARGAALRQLGRLGEAEAAYLAALQRTPTSQRSLIGLGYLALEGGRPLVAAKYFESVIAQDSQQSQAHRGLSDARQMAGHLLASANEAEWHHPPNGVDWGEFEQPRWTRSSHHERTVLIAAGGALGDTIQMLRYLPLVKSYGGRLVVQCPRALVPLVHGMSAVDEAVAFGGPCSAFDVHERLTRLPLVFETELSTIPDTVPYLFASLSRRERWRQRLKPDHRFMVGLTWGGNVTNRTAAVRFASLRHFAPLAAVANVRFVALQLSPQSSELLTPPKGLRIETVLDDGCSLEDTAAVIAQLDLVITVDTMMAHLAGGLACPVWTVLPQVAGFRWLQEGDRTPWYPTMRLFRQARQGDWTDVLERVAAALAKHVTQASERARPHALAAADAEGEAPCQSAR